MLYEPEAWVLLDMGENVFKIFGAWRGSYLTGESWKMNSGIESVEEFEEYYDVLGYSGSIYRCYKNSVHSGGMYTSRVLDDYKRKLPQIKEIDMEDYLAKINV